MTDILNWQIVWLQADKTTRTSLMLQKQQQKEESHHQNHITMHNKIDLSFMFLYPLAWKF